MSDLRCRFLIESVISLTGIERADENISTQIKQSKEVQKFLDDGRFERIRTSLFILNSFSFVILFSFHF